MRIDFEGRDVTHMLGLHNESDREVYNGKTAAEWCSIASQHAITASVLLAACKGVYAALNKAQMETGEILWLDGVLPGVHESVLESLRHVIEEAEG